MTLYDYVVAIFAILGLAAVLSAVIFLIGVFIFVWKDLL